MTRPCPICRHRPRRFAWLGWFTLGAALGLGGTLALLVAALGVE